MCPVVLCLQVTLYKEAEVSVFQRYPLGQDEWEVALASSTSSTSTSTSSSSSSSSTSSSTTTFTTRSRSRLAGQMETYLRRRSLLTHCDITCWPTIG